MKNLGHYRSGLSVRFSQWSRLHSRAFPDGLVASALQSPAHGPLGARKSAANRSIQGDVLLFVNDTRKTPKYHFYPAHMIDAAPWTIHVFQPHAHALDGSRKFPELPVELLPDGRPGVLVEVDSKSSDVSLNLRLPRPRGFSLDRLREPARGDLSLIASRRTGSSARGLGAFVLPWWSGLDFGAHDLAASLDAAHIRNCARSLYGPNKKRSATCASASCVALLE